MTISVYLAKWMERLKNLTEERLFIYLTALGIIIRFLIPYTVAFLPFNETDPRNWEIAGELVLDGKNPYVVSERERSHMKYINPALVYLFSAVLVLIDKVTGFPFVFSLFTVLLFSDILTLLILKRLLQIHDKNALLAHAYFLNPLTLIAFWYLQLDLVIALVIAAFIYSFRLKKMTQAAIAVGIGAAIKIFTILFVIVFLTRKSSVFEKIKLLLISAGIPILATLPYFLLAPSTVFNELFFTYTRDIYYNRISWLNALLIFSNSGAERERTPVGILGLVDQIFSIIMYAVIFATCYLARKKPPEQQILLIILVIYLLFRDLQLHHLVYVVPTLVITYSLMEQNESNREKIKLLFILISFTGYLSYFVHYKLYRPGVVTKEEFFGIVIIALWIINLLLFTFTNKISMYTQINAAEKRHEPVAVYK